MAKPKRKNGISCLFYLDREEVELLNYLSSEIGLSKSETVGFLIRNFYLNKDIESRLKQLQLEKEKIEKQISKLIEELNQRKEFEKKLKEEEKTAIKILKRKIREGEGIFELERIAKFWALKLRTTPEELLFKAGMQIKNEVEK